MADTGFTQAALAAALRVSQPRVSQILAMCRSHGIDTNRLGSPDVRMALVDLYVARHQPQVVSERYWYALEPLTAQTEVVVSTARDASAHVVVSADVACDLTAAWRHPTIAVLYVDQELTMPPAFVEATGSQDASVIVRHTRDVSLTECWKLNRYPLAHPVQQVWDLHDLGGVDRIEAAQRIVERVVLAEDCRLPA